MNPQDVAADTISLTEWLALGAFGISLLSAVGVVIKVFVDKFGKGPEARQAEVELGVGILKSQIERSEKAEERWLRQEEYLRGELRKADEEKGKSDVEIERLVVLLREAREQIDDLRQELKIYQKRQKILAYKIARGEQITLADITGETAALALSSPVLEEEDIEDTLRVR